MKTIAFATGLAALTLVTTASADVWSDLYETDSKPAISYTVPGDAHDGRSGFKNGVLSSAVTAKQMVKNERASSWKVNLKTSKYNAVENRSLFKKQILSSAVPTETNATAEFARFEAK